jgi:ACS family tartrate transporter-like MFS transporter
MRFTTMQIGLLATLPYAAGLVAMVLVSRHADRSGERRPHFAVPMLVASAGLLGAALTLDMPVLALVCMTTVGAGVYSALGAFWPLPTALLSPAVAATGIAMINSLGNLGGFSGPYAVGFLQDRTGSFLPGLVLLSFLAGLGGLVAILVTRRPR